MLSKFPNGNVGRDMGRVEVTHRSHLNPEGKLPINHYFLNNI